MSVFVIWQFRFPSENLERGVNVTKAIWRDMLSFPGYEHHEIIQDLDDPGRLLVVSKWRSREDADRVREQYASSPNASLRDALVSERPLRFVGQELPTQDGNL